MRLLTFYTVLCCLLFCAGTVAAQQGRPTDSAQGKIIEIIKADRYHQTTDSLNQSIASLAGNAQVKQANTLFSADSIVLNQTLNTLEAFGNIHINDADSIHTYSQYLKYLGNEKKAYLKKKVKLTDNKGVLTTEELEYDMSVKIGTYLKGGKLVNKKTTLTSTEGYYYGETHDVIFKRKVVMIDTTSKILTDTLQYNTNTEVMIVTGPSTIYNEKRIINTRNAFYDTKNKKVTLYERSTVDDSAYTITADDMAFDDSTHKGEFRGNAVVRGKDSTEGADIIANNIKVDSKNDIILATQKPVLLIKQQRDTIFVTADTIYSAKLSSLLAIKQVPSLRDSSLKELIVPANQKDSTSDHYFEAYYHVRIFSDSLQATCDSLFYSLTDSVFRMFRQPIVWAQQNQIFGDTIYLFVKNKKPERLFVFNNALALSRVDSSIYFNQLKGNTINALFDTSGKINLMRAKGYSENVYYLVDDNKRFTGVNKNSADFIEIHFDSGRAKRVVWVNQLQGDMSGMRQVDHESLKLRGFKWLEARRPKSKFDIFSDVE